MDLAPLYRTRQLNAPVLNHYLNSQQGTDQTIYFGNVASVERLWLAGLAQPRKYRNRFRDFFGIDTLEKQIFHPM
jgi:hypothetical protein